MSASTRWSMVVEKMLSVVTLSVASLVSKLYDLQ